MVEEQVGGQAKTQAPTQQVAASQAQFPNPEPEREIFSWKTASRPFKRRTREFWVRLVAAASVIGLVFFLAEGVMPVVLLISIIFLFYVLSTVEPEEIEYKVTNKGLKIAEKLNSWETLNRFWFTSRLGNNLMVVETKALPGRIEMLINSKDILKLREIITKYLPEEKVAPTGVDKASDWLLRKLSAN